jgi:hypothetical protein
LHHLVSASKATPMRSSNGSWDGRPTGCDPMGRAAPVKPQGTEGPAAEIVEVRSDGSTEQAIDLRQELGEVELGRASGTGGVEVGSLPVSLFLPELGISFGRAARNRRRRG